MKKLIFVALIAMLMVGGMLLSCAIGCHGDGKCNYETVLGVNVVGDNWCGYGGSPTTKQVEKAADCAKDLLSGKKCTC